MVHLMIFVNLLLVLLFSIMFWPILKFLENKLTGLIYRPLPTHIHSNHELASFFANLIRILSKFKSENTLKGVVGIENWAKHITSFLFLFLSIVPFYGISFWETPVNGGNEIPDILFVFLMLNLCRVSSVFLFGTLFKKELLILEIRKFFHIVSSQFIMTTVFFSTLAYYSTFHIHEIIQHQKGTILGFAPSLGILLLPLNAILFFVAILINNMKRPFDPTNQSLIENINLAYRLYSVPYILIKVSNYLNLIASVWIFTSLFMGGHLLLPGQEYIVHLVPELSKAMEAFSILIKITVVFLTIKILGEYLPLAKIDNILGLTWKICYPLSVASLIIVMVMKYY